MNLLLISREYPPYEKGGMCRIVEYMAELAHEYGICLTIVANHPKFGIKAEVINGVTIYRIPSFGSTFLTQIPSFAFFASILVAKMQSNFDLIYSNYTLLFCKINKPLIVGFHSTRYGQYIASMEIGKHLHAFLNRLYIPLDKMLLKKADGIISLSEELTQEIAKFGRIDKPISIIPGGVDTSTFKPRNQHRFTSPNKKILYVGRLDSTKGLHILFHALKKITNLKVELVLAGEGSEKQNLLKLAHSLSLNVNFLGQITHKNLPDIYNDADLFVLPSLREGGFPLAAREAMACATPTIVSDACPDIGIPRFAKGSVESLKILLSELLSSEARLQKLSEEGLKLSQKHSWDLIVNQTCKFLRQFA